MKNVARRTMANLIAVALVSTVLIIYALAQLLTGALLDDSYPLTVRVPNTGGLIPLQEVTLSGVPIGLVDSFTLAGDKVDAHLAIDEGRQVPTDVDVVILRRSAVGEQALDFRPREGAGDRFFEPGDLIEPGDVVTPVEVQRLLTLADEVFGPIDPETAGKLVGELADIVRGRRDDLRSIITDSADFSENIADSGQDYDRLFAQGRRVTAALADNREALAASLGDMADAAAVLSDMRTEFEGVLAEAPPVLTQVAGLVDRSEANLSCLITDFASINTYMARDRQLHNAEEALRLNQWFFVAADIHAGIDPKGRVWNRIQFLPPEQPPARSYLPEKRPIPDILPGGACSSPLGQGAPSASQASYQKTVPEARIRRPADDRRQAVRSGGPPLGTGRPMASGDAGPVFAVPTAPLPATGGGLSFLLGLLLLALGTRAARETLRDRAAEKRDE